MPIGPPPAMPRLFAAPADAGRDLGRLIDEAGRLAEAAYASVFALAFDEIAPIELPPGAEARVDRAQMRALAALYLAADLEPAGVFQAAENLAALAASGGLQADLGPAAPLVHRFWRDRHNRTNRDDRLAFFGRLFGASYGAVAANGANMDFEALMLALCEALYALGDSYTRNPHGGISSQTKIRTAARNLLANLAEAGGGATPFMAREVMDGLKASLEILKHPQLRGIFGARDLWGVVDGIARLAGRRTSYDARVFVQRGQAGMTLMVWLAEAVEKLRVYGAPLVTVKDPVIPAAVEWLQSSLTISESQAAQAQAPRQAGPGGGLSDWAEFGL